MIRPAECQRYAVFGQLFTSEVNAKGLINPEITDPKIRINYDH